jgi:hypothetical protein
VVVVAGKVAMAVGAVVHSLTNVAVVAAVAVVEEDRRNRR